MGFRNPLVALLEHFKKLLELTIFSRIFYIFPAVGETFSTSSITAGSLVLLF
jgi:hypothetical protein